MSTKYEAILFDLGNVVIRIHFERCFQTWAQYTGKDSQIISKSFVFDDMYSAHEVSAITAEQYHTHICKMIDSNISFNEFVSGWNAIFGDPISETRELIHELKKNYKIYAFTNSNVLHRQVWSEKYKDTLKHFDQIFCSSQLKLRKPDLAAFEQICINTGISKERFIFVDDLEANIVGGKKFGFKSILFLDPVTATDEIRSLINSH